MISRPVAPQPTQSSAAFRPSQTPTPSPSGDRQDCSHSAVLQFITSGQPYVACDMTSPDATVLLRQYQTAVTFPIMRVHQMHGVPRFPFLWCGAHAAGGGTEEHCTAFREALNLRYALLPYLYSLAHMQHRTGKPMAHPASYEFPQWGDGDQTYMVGGVLLPADMDMSRSSEGANDSGENTTVSRLPAGRWYTFNTTTAINGNQTLTQTNVALTDNVIFVRPGAIIPLQQVCRV